MTLAPIDDARLAEVRARFDAIPTAEADSLTGHVKGLLARLATAESTIAKQAERIAVLEAAVAAEREACAHLCETLGEADPDKEDHFSDYLAGFSSGYEAAASNFSAAIRARALTEGGPAE